MRLKILQSIEKGFGFKNEVKWFNAIFILMYHVFGFYWCWLYAFPVKVLTVFFAILMYCINATGITCGVHRLFTHRSYKAIPALKIFLVICFCGAGQVSSVLFCYSLFIVPLLGTGLLSHGEGLSINHHACSMRVGDFRLYSPGFLKMFSFTFLSAIGGQNSIYEWVRDHRLHHKFSDTDADPHNANRGFFFSHIGWLMMKKNEEVKKQGKKIDMSDIEEDKIIMFQEKYHTFSKLFFCYILPISLNIYLWNEDWKCAVAWQAFIRFLFVFHAELSVNSFAHLYGYQPYNKTIVPKENAFVSSVSFGEGWHNYHHSFPFDFKAAEFCDQFNWSTNMIRWWARNGWAYDLKEATPEMVCSLMKRAGDCEYLNDQFMIHER